MTSLLDLEIPYLAQQHDKLYTAGLPTTEQFKQIAACGVKHIINLIPATDLSFDEESLVEGLSMHYDNISIENAFDLTFENASKLEAMLTQYQDDVVFLHCVSSNRVGALIAMITFMRGADIESSIQKGRNAGLHSLEPIVRDLCLKAKR